MPELPEVETIVNDLRPMLEGRRITRAEESGKGMLKYPSASEFEGALDGVEIAGVGRRGKYVVLSLGKTAAPVCLVLHLGMTGRMLVAPHGSPLAPHTHLRLALEGGEDFRFIDYRRFGRILLGTLPELRAAGAMPRLGLEPLGAGFTLRAFTALLGATQRPVKAVLLDQSAIAGIGNIYSDESCYEARVNPLSPANGLAKGEAGKLFRAIRKTLSNSVALRGSSIDDYRDAFGEKGGYQQGLLAYGRGGQPCFRCETPLLSVKAAGRTTVYCPRCQPMPLR